MSRIRGIVVLAFWFQLLAGAAGYAEERTRNLALNRAAYASSTADYINTPHMATDGHMDTKWHSLGGTSQGRRATVDLC